MATWGIPTNHDRQAQSHGIGGAAIGLYRKARSNSETPEPITLGPAVNVQSDGLQNADAQDPQEASDNHIGELARNLTRQSSRHQGDGASQRGGGDQGGDDGGDFIVEKDSELDPFSKNFSAKAWTRRILGVTSRDPEKYPHRTAGVAFRNLNVFGYGSDSGYQMTVGNAPWAIFGTIKDFVMGNKRKVDILKGFDGVLDAGDMLVVLGPPGR